MPYKKTLKNGVIEIFKMTMLKDLSGKIEGWESKGLLCIDERNKTYSYSPNGMGSNHLKFFTDGCDKISTEQYQAYWDKVKKEKYKPIPII